jgi:hypothetical protein
VRYLLSDFTDPFSADVKLERVHARTLTHYKRNRYADMTPSWVNPEGSYSLSAGQVTLGNKETVLVQMESTFLVKVGSE